MKIAHIGHRMKELLTFRPYASGSPRASIHPTCGPVHTSNGVGVESARWTSAIWSSPL